mmetsp:Transcript_63630/g.134078  ORF Transcript_63630/g.134078 Transcript_63630/m.134078 type:complete len:233 (-) Transcript_63630:1383-2081(-)
MHRPLCSRVLARLVWNSLWHLLPLCQKGSTLKTLLQLRIAMVRQAWKKEALPRRHLRASPHPCHGPCPPKRQAILLLLLLLQDCQLPLCRAATPWWKESQPKRARIKQHTFEVGTTKCQAVKDKRKLVETLATFLCHNLTRMSRHSESNPLLLRRCRQLRETRRKSRNRKIQRQFPRTKCCPQRSKIDARSSQPGSPSPMKTRQSLLRLKAALTSTTRSLRPRHRTRVKTRH